MDARRWVMGLVALLVVNGSTAQGPQKYYCASRCSRKNLPCPSPCSACPKIPPCPAPSCPHPECPFIPRLHPCPEPVCSPLPKIPACPEPQVKLTCPHVVCPHHSCPACPRCPDILPCPVCPTTPPPTTTVATTTVKSTVPERTTRTTITPWTTIGPVINATTKSEVTRTTVMETATPDAAATRTTVKTLTTETSARTTVTYPTGYEKTPGIGIYKFFELKKSWIDANTTCGRDGAHLAIPKNRNEADKILRMMREHAPDVIHVGFYALTNTVFVSALGNSMTSEQRALWHSGEPRGGLLYGCTYISGSGMSTESCGDRELFVCEIPMNEQHPRK